jgi:hypothetical protein
MIRICVFSGRINITFKDPKEKWGSKMHILKKYKMIFSVCFIFALVGCATDNYRVASQGGSTHLQIANKSLGYVIEFDKGPFAGLQLGPREISQFKPVSYGVLELEVIYYQINKHKKGRIKFYLFIGPDTKGPIPIKIYK